MALSGVQRNVFQPALLRNRQEELEYCVTQTPLCRSKSGVDRKGVPWQLLSPLNWPPTKASSGNCSLSATTLSYLSSRLPRRAVGPQRSVGEGSAVRHSVDSHLPFAITLFLSLGEPVTFSFAHPTRCFSTLPQNRHPACPGMPWERSASHICRRTKGLQREAEGPRRCLCADAIRSFPAANIKSLKLRAHRSCFL